MQGQSQGKAGSRLDIYRGAVGEYIRSHSELRCGTVRVYFGCLDFLAIDDFKMACKRIVHDANQTERQPLLLPLHCSFCSSFTRRYIRIERLEEYSCVFINTWKGDDHMKTPLATVAIIKQSFLCDGQRTWLYE